ncbi:MAG: helix-hairpin-helix domain-containing protein [Bacteroidia bacterium]|nr:helix-hairpin-helix domain-containing protein [Bacteroidia bacterium]
MIFQKLKSFIRDYFTLTTRERNGGLALMIIIIAQIGFLAWYNYFKEPESSLLEKHQLILIKAEEKLIDQQRHKKDSVDKHFAGNYESVPIIPERLFDFDPNTITDTEWQALGLSEKQTRIVRNYLNKGGKFRKKEDVASIYGIQPALYERLEPHIKINPSEKLSNPYTFEKKIHPAKAKIDLNTADTTLLCELPMVGPGRARMIYKYREALGGFHRKEQLLEVFTIDSATFEAINKSAVLKTTSLRKLNLNQDTLKHPYLTKTIASAIVSYRRQHGNFSKLEDLRKVLLIDNQLYNKLVPYLTIE